MRPASNPRPGTSAFTDAELVRGRALIALLRDTGVTKYNTGREQRLVSGAAAGQRAVLVPGQVEDDASILRGCSDVRTNRELLVATRAAAPDAWIIYKPHPDVLAGNRRGGIDPALLATLADQVVTDVAMAACLCAVDTVHTMTSLTGFEALIHGKQVHTYGTPFYAGWGLTQDRHSCPRRGRSLALEAMAFGVLVQYPRYLDPATGLFVGPELVIDRLDAQRRQGPEVRASMPLWRRLLIKVMHVGRKHR